MLHGKGSVLVKKVTKRSKPREREISKQRGSYNGWYKSLRRNRLEAQRPIERLGGDYNLSPSE